MGVAFPRQQRKGMQGEKYLQEAEQESAKTSCCGGNKEFKANAADLFQRAALEYKKGSQFKESGAAWTESAKCQGLVDEPVDESEAYSQAATMYKLAAEACEWAQVDSVKAALGASELAMEHIDTDRLMAVAHMYKAIVDLKLKYAVLVSGQEQLYKTIVQGAVDNCNKAAALFKQEGQNVESQDCLVRGAQISCEFLHEYMVAIETFETVNKQCLGIAELSMDADTFFLDATLVRFAAKEDVSDVQHRVLSYCTHDDVLFDQKPEFAFLRAIEAALREKSKAQLDDAKSNYIAKKSTSLNKWRRLIFDRIYESADVVDPMDVDLG